MRILVAECAPKALKRHRDKSRTRMLHIQEAGCAGKQNGELLTLADSAFDVLVTVDTNLK